MLGLAFAGGVPGALLSGFWVFASNSSVCWADPWRLIETQVWEVTDRSSAKSNLAFFLAFCCQARQGPTPSLRGGGLLIEAIQNHLFLSDQHRKWSTVKKSR